MNCASYSGNNYSAMGQKNLKKISPNAHIKTVQACELKAWELRSDNQIRMGLLQ